MKTISIFIFIIFITSNCFGNNIAIEQTVESYYDVQGPYKNFYTFLAQSFTAPHNFSMSGITIEVAQFGSPTGNLTLRIETDGGGMPSGTLVNPAATTIITPPSDGNFYYVTTTFTPSFLLTSGTVYWIRLVTDFPQPLPSNFWGIVCANNDYAGGTMAEYYLTLWHNVPYDMYFILYVQDPAGYAIIY